MMIERLNHLTLNWWRFNMCANDIRDIADLKDRVKNLNLYIDGMEEELSSLRKENKELEGRLQDVRDLVR